MTKLQLSSQTRTDFRKSETKRLRREDQIPATVYGKGFEPEAITVSLDDISNILKVPGGKLSLIDLSVDGKSSAGHPVMFKHLQIDAVSKRIMHIDFHRVSMDEPVRALVPIMLAGEAPGVKLGGLLDQVTDNLDVKALPNNIPTHISVDVSKLDLGQSILVEDLDISPDVEVVGPLPGSVVVSMRMPTVQEEAVEEGEISAAESGTEAAAEEASAE
ncbi:MAG: 50S ribosomal protein L25 [Armatimonadota bacterium]|jgi:large subunit ribosomal protein L25|nr:50S ribosomal protein L25 [Armatimonadota bacterium]